MKKILSILLAAVAVTALAVPAEASVSGITAADVTLQESETVYIPVSLNTAVTGTAMSLTYTYDASVLEILPEECSWIPAGALKDFSSTSRRAVWAAAGEKKISGDICVLAFRAVNVQTFTETQVSCTVTVKNGSRTVGEYQSACEVTRICTHQFGEWTTGGPSGHVRQCALCKAEELQSHVWGSAKTSADAQRPNVTLITHQCQICGAEKISEVIGAAQEILPTSPEAAVPSDPAVIIPEETKPQPTDPLEDPDRTAETVEREPEQEGRPPEDSANSGWNGSAQQNLSSNHQPKDYNQPSQETAQQQTEPHAQTPFADVHPETEANGRDFTEETHPMAIKIEGAPETADEKKPGTDTAGKESASGGLVAAAAVAVAAVGAWVLLRKGKKG